MLTCADIYNRHSFFDEFVRTYSGRGLDIGDEFKISLSAYWKSIMPYFYHTHDFVCTTNEPLTLSIVFEIDSNNSSFAFYSSSVTYLTHVQILQIKELINDLDLDWEF